MSGRRMATIGLSHQTVDVLAGDDVDGRSGRLLTVAELQSALAAALGARSGRRTPMRPSADDPAGDDPAGQPTRVEAEAGSPSTIEPTDCPVVPVEERRWGAAPVPVGPAGDRPVPVGPDPGDAVAEPIVGEFGFQASELLALSPRDRDRRTDEILAAGWVGSRQVLVGSTFSGAGRSTVAAAVACAAAAANITTLLVDATGLDESAVAIRSAAASVSRRPWTWALDPEAPVHLAALRRRSTDGAVPVVALAGDRGAAPPTEAVAAALRADFRLVVADLPAGGPAARAAFDGAGPDALMVIVCRPDLEDLDHTTELLHQLTTNDPDTEQRVVLTVTPGSKRIDRSARRRVAEAAQATAGVTTVPYLSALVSRRAAVTEQNAVLAAGRVLVAAARGVQPTPSNRSTGGLSPQ